MKTDSLADKTDAEVLAIADEANPRQRTHAPDPPQPLARARLLRPVFVAAYADQDLKPGQIILLTPNEMNFGIFEAFVAQLEPFPDANPYQAFYSKE